MINKLKQIVSRFEELEKLLIDPEILADNAKVIEIAKERSALEDVVNQSREYIDIKEQIEEYRGILESDDEELKESYVYNFILYEAVRMRSETAQYISPGDAWRTVKSPSAALSTASRAVRFSNQILPWNITEGYNYRYSRLVTSANTGAVLKVC